MRSGPGVKAAVLFRTHVPHAHRHSGDVRTVPRRRIGREIPRAQTPSAAVSRLTRGEVTGRDRVPPERGVAPPRGAFSLALVTILRGIPHPHRRSHRDARSGRAAGQGHLGSSLVRPVFAHRRLRYHCPRVFTHSVARYSRTRNSTTGRIPRAFDVVRPLRNPGGKASGYIWT